MKVKILHNPRCSKSRATLQLLRDGGIEPEVVRYLETPPSTEEIERILQALGCGPRELMRKGEPEYRELGLDDEGVNDAELVQAMADNPILIQRPIVLNGDKAAIGRPPESVLDIL